LGQTHNSSELLDMPPQEHQLHCDSLLCKENLGALTALSNRSGLVRTQVVQMCETVFYALELPNNKYFCALFRRRGRQGIYQDVGKFS